MKQKKLFVMVITIIMAQSSFAQTKVKYLRFGYLNRWVYDVCYQVEPKIREIVDVVMPSKSQEFIKAENDLRDKLEKEIRGMNPAKGYKGPNWKLIRADQAIIIYKQTYELKVGRDGVCTASAFGFILGKDLNEAKLRYEQFKSKPENKMNNMKFDEEFIWG